MRRLLVISFLAVFVAMSSFAATSWLGIKNSASGTLGAAIADGVTTSVTMSGGDGANFPDAPFHVLIGTEILEVTNKGTGDNWTATRGAESTTPTAHANGSLVRGTLTAEQITEIQDAVNNIEDGTTELADLSTGINGLDVNPGSDTDADLLTVGVTGAPNLYWDESEDSFRFTKKLWLNDDLYVGGGDITTDAATLVINAGGTVDVQDALYATSFNITGIPPTAHFYVSGGNSYIGNENTAALFFRTTGQNVGSFETGGNLNLLFSLEITKFLNLLAASELTISSGAVTATKSLHDVDTESDGASDDLDTISGGTEGDILIIRAEHTDRTVVAKDGTGNLNLGGDRTLDNTQDRLMLVNNGSGWDELSFADNGA